jgi:hypothetical protein
MRANISPSRHVVVDDNIWLDLVRAGYPVESAQPSVVWVYKLGADPAIQVTSVDYVAYAAMNLTYVAKEVPHMASLLRDSYVVATFGEGDNKVIVRKVVHTRVE